MLKNSFVKARSFLLSYLYVQLFISLWSLPILIAWGIPFCPLSFVGNLIFTPILIGFLILSSLIFFTQLLAIPNGILITLLEYLCGSWKHILHSVHNSWSFGCVIPHFGILCAIPLLAVAICSAKKLTSRLQRTGALFLLLSSLMILLPAWYTPKKIIEEINSPGGPVTLIYVNNTVTLIDPGSLGKRTSALSWVQYSLIPIIIQKTGKTSIDHFITLYPTCITFEVLAHLCQKIKVDKLYIPIWNNKIPPSAFKHFITLKNTLNQGLIRISKKPLCLTLSPTAYLNIISSDGEHKLNGYTIADIYIKGQIDNTPIKFYASKSTLKNSSP